MGIFGPSKQERLQVQYALIKENESAIKQGHDLLTKKEQINKIINLGLITDDCLNNDDYGKKMEAYRQAYALTMTFKYILYVTKNFNKVMGTIFADSLNSEQQEFAVYLVEIEGKMIKLRTILHSVMETSEIKKMEDYLNKNHGEDRYGIKF